MKKVFIYFIMQCFFTLQLFAKKIVDYTEYRVPNLVTVEEMQSLVGKTYLYYPSFSKYPGIGDGKFLTGIFGDKSINVKIISIEGQTKNKASSNKMTITVAKIGEYGNEQNVTFTYRSGDYIYKSTKPQEFSYNQFTLIDYDKIRELHQSEIGKVFSDPLVKNTYKVVDVTLREDYLPDFSAKRVQLHYLLENSLTSEKKLYIASVAGEKCFVNDKLSSYHTYLDKVEKPSNPAVKYGETKVVNKNEQGVTTYSYKDDFIDIQIYGLGERFYFTLKNNSENTQKIIWDEAVYVDYNGKSSRIMHDGIKYSQREAPQSPTTIIRGAKIDELVCPISNVYYDDGYRKEWRTKSMYPENCTEDKKVQLMLPIQIKDIINEYIFIFDYKYEYNHPERLNL